MKSGFNFKEPTTIKKTLRVMVFQDDVFIVLFFAAPTSIKFLNSKSNFILRNAFLIFFIEIKNIYIYKHSKN